MAVTVATVGDLIDFLSTRPRDQLVVLAKDAEGNGYSPLSDAEDAYYYADTTWSGEVAYEDVEVDGEIEDGAVRAVVLGPVN
ncbi:hypothetical protein [Nocardia wallacei]|uniref:hypothetical protein n=1 Tax=Nocardia wallacei TaxID=480035 RepID=UPI002454A2A9|nr:hypothetical protein [Nocardia wallacei]